MQEIPASPFHIKVDPSHDASKVKAEGPGLNRTGRCLGRGWAGLGFVLGGCQALTTVSGWAPQV